MDQDTSTLENNSSWKKLTPKKMNQIFIGVIVLSVVFGIGTGYTLAQKPNSESAQALNNVINDNPQHPQQDNRTFRDFAEGTIEPLPKPKNPNEYVEGTHLLKRDGATPVTLTSSVVDLSEYNGKKVKVYGETQKAVKAGWLMDVGKVDVIQ